MVRVWGATARACLLFLLLVALCAQGAQAAPWRPLGADDDKVGSPYPASQLDPGLEPQEDPRGSIGEVPPWNPAPEPAGMGPTGDGTESKGDAGSQMGSRTLALGDGVEVSPRRPLPDPRLLPALEPSWSPRGRLRAKDKAGRITPSPASSDIVEEIIKELAKAAPGMARETVPKEVLWKLSGRTLPLSGKGTEAMRASATPEVSPRRPLPDPRLLPALEPSWSPRGRLRAKDEAGRIKPSPASSHVLEKSRKELEKAAPGTDSQTVPKDALWQGSSRTLPLSDKGTEAKQATATPGVDGENNANTAEPPNFRSYCIEGAAAFLVPLLLVTVACCVLIRRWRQKNQRLAAAQAAQRDSRGRSLSPSRRPEHRARPESQARRQRPPAVPGRPARLPPARPPRPPRPAPAQWKARDRPSAPQSSWARTPPPRPPPPSFKGWGRPPRGAAWGNY